jgi:serine/threonine protein kinase
MHLVGSAQRPIGHCITASVLLQIMGRLDQLGLRFRLWRVRLMVLWRCAGNVLLSSSTDNRHKFCAKVADFGLARDLGVVSRVETRTYGTLTHMAPEVLSADMVSKVCSSPP